MDKENLPFKCILKNETFGWKFGFWFGQFDGTAVEKYVKRNRLSNVEYTIEHPGGCSGCCWDFDYGSLVWMPNTPRDLEDFSTLVHELQHSVLYASRGLGFGDGKSSDEFRCYILGWLFSKIGKKFWK